MGFPAELERDRGHRLERRSRRSLPIPEKDELLDYLRRSYEALKNFVELLDASYPNFENVDEESEEEIEIIRLNLLVFLRMTAVISA